ncbi:terminase family protein [Hymenobacter sp. HSC-4F20]|uniref:DNA-packaging protein n=1 Tax=Hymenobacter sp. HSC-4F20 TaxID=2864135 RepID=UPI001C7346B9|nr:terminase family protein [Hymenobacter sp. HSC-4F20]MBX0290121.1 terminase family protein [Hymenobacter sp. HSC-4F20]
MSTSDKERLLALLQERNTRWSYLARPEQLAPPGDWFIWLILAGRGWGKTRTAAEWIAQEARNTPKGRFALVAATFADAKLTMLEGESGLLSILRDDELRGGSQDTGYNRSTGELFLANGAQFNVYTAEKPRGLRGPQHHAAWCDELAAWSDAHIGDVDTKDQTQGQGTTWSNLLFGLRLGPNPKIVIATTPKPVKLLFDLVKQAQTRGNVHITRGKTSDNLKNLSQTFKANVIASYEGTTTGKQELDGELLEDVKGALWSRALLNLAAVEVTDVPESLKRIVVALDPAVTTNQDSDETGIIVAALGLDGLLYVLEDHSGKYTPSQWATVANDLYEEWQADAVVAEVNQGGDMVENTIRQVNPNINYRGVRATRGKVLRAEPVVALYEQRKVRHVYQSLQELENQMCSWSAATGQKSPDRVDALVWAVTELTQNVEKRKAQFYAND